MEIPIPIEDLLAVGGEGPLPQSLPQLGLGQPPVPGHFCRVGGADLRKHGIAYAKPVGAEADAVEEREPKADCRARPQLLTDLAGSRLLIGLADCCGAPDPEFVVPWETGQLVGTPVDEIAALLITAHHRGDSMQPALPDGFPPTDYAQDMVLGVNAFHEFIDVFIHEAQGGRAH